MSKENQESKISNTEAGSVKLTSEEKAAFEKLAAAAGINLEKNEKPIEVTREDF